MMARQMMHQETGEKLNVLHVTPSMSPSWGAAIVVSELTSELTGQEAHCEIVATHGYQVGTGQVPTPGVLAHSFDGGFGLPARTWTGYSADLRRNMGRQGHTPVTERYTWQAAAAKMGELYRTLVT